MAKHAHLVAVVANALQPFPEKWGLVTATIEPAMEWKDGDVERTQPAHVVVVANPPGKSRQSWKLLESDTQQEADAKVSEALALVGVESAVSRALASPRGDDWATAEVDPEADTAVLEAP